MNEECTAALRVFSFTKTVDDIRKILDRIPDESHEIGENFSPRNPNSQKYDRTTCIFESGLSMSTAINDHVNAILEFIESKQEAFSELAADTEFDIMCSISSPTGQGCINLEKSLLRRLANCDCDIAFDIYLMN